MKRFITLFAALMTSGATMAQNYTFGGLLIERERLSPTDIFSLSQNNFTFGTARSMAMAGAFTSLGADLSSMSINPAGLGMYRSSEVGVTPMMTFQNSKNSATNNMSNSTNRFAFGNFGFSLKAYEGTGKVLAVNVGFAYNRLADYNYNYSFYQNDNLSTLGGVFAHQLQDSAGRIGINDKNHICDSYGSTDFGLSTELWGGVMAYKCGLVNMINNRWTLDEYPIPFSTDQFTTVESRGSAGEYTLSAGMNIDNKFYIGASLGLQSISRHMTIAYGENVYPSEQVNPETQPYVLRSFDYMQWSDLSGTGVNFKLGMVWRPVAGLRLGIALHTPTFYTINFSYSAGMDSTSESIGNNPDGYNVIGGNVYGSEATPRFEDVGGNSWDFTSPTRLLFGASYTFGKYAIVSVDYERDWYNSIRMKNMPAGFDFGYYNDYFRSSFKGSNTIRAGIEVKPIERLAIRAGYGYNGSMLKDEPQNYLLYSSPIIYRTDLITAGLGFAISPAVRIDAAYQYVTARQTDYRLFFAENPVDSSLGDYSGVFSTDLRNHNVALSLTVKF